MATFGDLQSGVQKETKRQQFFDPLGNDVTMDALVGFVNRALRSIQRMLVVRDAETVARVGIGPSDHPFPLTLLDPPYRYTNDLWMEGLATPLYRYRNVREFHQDYPPSMPVGTGRVTRGYCIYDGNLHLGPAPVEQWMYFWHYVTWLAPLVQTTDSNWYTLNADDAVLYYSCREAAAWLMEDQLYAFYDQLGQRALDEVRKTIRNEEVAEGQLQGRLFGSYPSGGAFVSVGLRRRDVYP